MRTKQTKFITLGLAMFSVAVFQPACLGEDIAELVALLQLPKAERESRMLTNCPSGQWAYDPVAEVFAVIEDGATIKCLYLYSGSGEVWNCKTNWGRVCLSYGLEYAKKSTIKFESIVFVGHGPEGESRFLLKAKAKGGFFKYTFKVDESGQVSKGLWEISAKEYRKLLGQTKHQISPRSK